MAPVTPFDMTSLLGMIFVALFGTGAGVPLGIPPQEPDPVMANIAPEQCLYYVSWVGMAKPDPESSNQTEQLLAEKEVIAFVADVERALKAAADKMSDRYNGDHATLIAAVPLLARTFITHPVTFFVERAEKVGRGVRGKGALVVKLGDESKDVGDLVDLFVTTIPPNIVEKVSVHGIECVRLNLQPGMLQLTIGRKDDYLIVAMGEGSFEGVLARATTPPPKWLTEGVESLDVPRLATFAYADLGAIAKLSGQFGDANTRKVLEVLGISSLTTLTSVSGLDETGFVSRTRAGSADPDKGLGMLLTGKPLVAKDLAAIPADATIAIAARVDLQHVVSNGLTLLQDLEPDTANEIRRNLNQLKQQTEIDFEDDLLAALGDVWTVHAAPSGGGLAAGWTLAIDLKDVQKMRLVEQRLLAFAKAMFAQGVGAPRIRKFQHAGQVAYTVEVPEEAFFIAPTWCVTDSHLVVTLLPQAMKSYLNHVKAKGRKTLAEHPAVATRLAGDNAPSAIAFQDVRAQFTTFYPLVQYGIQMLAGQMRLSGFDLDSTALPSIPAVAPHLLPKIATTCKTREGFEMYTHTTLPGANMGAAMPVIVALALPAIQSARSSARRAQASNNMKQIGLAMHNYHDVFKALPAAYNTDEDGKRLLSWRVHILPFIEQQALYDQFHLGEPWSSRHNRKLIAQMPAVYRSPRSQADPGKTNYLGNATEGGIFVAPSKSGKTPRGTRFRDIRDGTSNTIMVLEVSDTAAVIWTRPDDFEMAPDNPLRGLAGVWPDVFMAGFCDGSVRPIKFLIDRDALKALLTRAGGELIGDF